MEDVLNIIEQEKPDGVIVQFGGQTPLKLALAAGARRRADHRHIARQHRSGRRPRTILGAAREARLKQPANGMARSYEEAFKIAEALGYPVLVRPSYVLGGRAMQIVYDGEASKLHDRRGFGFARASGVGR